MKNARFILAGAAAALLAACNEKPSPEIPSPGREARLEVSEPPGSNPVFAVPDTFQAALGKVFEGYTQIQVALANDDLSKAKEAFPSMHAALHMMPKEGLDAPARAYWDSADARIMAALHPMAATGSIDSIRAHFKDFSAVMIDAIEKFGMDGESAAYQFHCPMADNNRGADWLQKDRELRNPYFGKSMSTCGNLVRTLDG